MLFSKRYRLNHCRHILQSTYTRYNKNRERLDRNATERFQTLLLSLQEAIDKKDRDKANQDARDLEALTELHIPQPKIWKWLESAAALTFALGAAIIIRQSWFELYEIPTGSMRPTYKEQDHLTVSKVQFGINTPLETSHILFEPDLVERGGTLIFSGDKLPYIDSTTSFMGIFPYKKRYVKRMIGKPGDLITFYGGQIYSLDEQGNDLASLRIGKPMEELEYIPFLSFEGQPSRINASQYVLRYFDKPLGRITMSSTGKLEGEVYNGKAWVADKLEAAKTAHGSIATLSDAYGFRNYAMSQIYTREELLKDEELKTLNLPDTSHYLVLRHTPHLDFSNEKARTFPLTLKTAIPLDNRALDRLAQALYTARFVVQNGKAIRYSLGGETPGKNSVEMRGIPDGTYEFYFGKAYEVLFGGITRELSPDHPLYAKERIPTLYNLGIQWDAAHPPVRFTYFRSGKLYVMGQPLFDAESEALKEFNEREQKRESESARYIAFKDQGAPQMIRTALQPFALSVPPRNYLVLGDNHAMSGDSRVFGFVPEANLQGVPEVIFWPLGERLGSPNQLTYPTFVKPRLIIWAVAALCLGAYLICRHRKLSRRVET